MKFLQRIPVDPFTGEADWGKRSYQDDWDAKSWRGENVDDVYSLSDMRALDDRSYADREAGRRLVPKGRLELPRPCED